MTTGLDEKNPVSWALLCGLGDVLWLCYLHDVPKSNQNFFSIPSVPSDLSLVTLTKCFSTKSSHLSTEELIRILNGTVPRTNPGGSAIVNISVVALKTKPCLVWPVENTFRKVCVSLNIQAQWFFDHSPGNCAS